MQYSADDLIGTKWTQPSDIAAMRLATESFAYYNREPYPTYNFGPSIWGKDEPLPPPPPYARIIIDGLTAFEFSGGAPVISVPDNPDADLFLADVIKRNSLDARWIERARILGNNGSLALKFSYDPDDKDSPVKISFLDCPQNCRIYMSPTDNTTPLMARIQFNWQSPIDGSWWQSREDWTKNWEVRYKDRKLTNGIFGSILSVPGYSDTFADDDKWEIESKDANKFGVIPVVVVKNQPLDGLPTGRGMCWGTFRDMDELASTYADQRRYNRVSSHPHIAIIDAEIQNTNELVPGEILSLMSAIDNLRAEVKLIEPSGVARHAVSDNLLKIESNLYKSVGFNSINAEALSNSGELTMATFRLLWHDQINTCDIMRAQWTFALTRFFENMLTGLRNIRASIDVAGYDANEQEVSVAWDYFIPTDADLLMVTNRTIMKVNAGLLSKERAAEQLAIAEGTPFNEVPDVVEEVKYNEVAIQGDPTDVGGDPLGAVNSNIDGTGLNPAE